MTAVPVTAKNVDLSNCDREQVLGEFAAKWLASNQNSSTKDRS